MSQRLNAERQKELEPERIAFAKAKLKELGIEITNETSSMIEFKHRGELVQFFPYSGWYSGKGLKSERGINHLLKQLKNGN